MWLNTMFWRNSTAVLNSSHLFSFKASRNLTWLLHISCRKSLLLAIRSFLSIPKYRSHTFTRFARRRRMELLCSHSLLEILVSWPLSIFFLTQPFNPSSLVSMLCIAYYDSPSPRQFVWYAFPDQKILYHSLYEYMS